MEKQDQPKLEPDRPEVIVDEDRQLQLLPGDEYIFDEMNLVELPFCVLSKDNHGLTTLPLSPEGNEYLQTSGKKHGLPTALARRTVLGLMWLTMEQNGFKGRILRVSLRDLVERYMFPDRFQSYRAGGKLLAAVEKELHRVAATRIYSNRWYDKKLGKHVEMDASIIDFIAVVEEGGKNSPRILEIGWGTKLIQSIQARYTKGLDVHTWLRITHPLDEALYRWLDRQLECKPRQDVTSCQKFARFKLGMHGERVERGGRTASSYIVEKFSEALERLNGIGFAVRMTVDKSDPDHALSFEKIESPMNEVVANDPAGDLVREFRRLCHGLPVDSKKTRIREGDRSLAAEWLKTYGYEQAVWMVKRCRELHEKGLQGNRPLYSFAGLGFYENVAVSDYQRWRQEKAGQLRLTFRELRQTQWEAYRDSLLRDAEVDLSEALLTELEAKARKTVLERHQNFQPSDSTMGMLTNVEFQSLKLDQLGVMPEDEFMGYETDELLRKALVGRHGKDPLESM